MAWALSFSRFFLSYDGVRRYDRPAPIRGKVLTYRGIVFVHIACLIPEIWTSLRTREPDRTGAKWSFADCIFGRDILIVR